MLILTYHIKQYQKYQEKLYGVGYNNARIIKESVKRYSPIEVAEKIVKYGHYGPWGKKMNETIQEVGRIVAGGYYDMQEVRISTMGRIRDIIRKRYEGIEFDKTEEKKEKHKRNVFTDANLEQFLDILNKEGKLTKLEYKYLSDCIEIAKQSKQVEEKYKKTMIKTLEQEPIYNIFLSKIRGIGETLSANIIRKYGYCDRYEYVSKLWAHSGLAVIAGQAQKLKRGQKAGYDPERRKLAWLISDCLMKNNKGYYRQLYETEKEKHLNRTYEPGYLEKNYNGYKSEDTKLTKGHAHDRALRKVASRFLSHYWEASREYLGLPIEKHYVVEHLNHSEKDIVSWKKALSMEQ